MDRTLTKRIGPIFMYIFRSIFHVANEIATPQFCINSNNSSIDCKNCMQKWKFATGNRNYRVLEYSKKITRVPSRTEEGGT